MRAAEQSSFRHVDTAARPSASWVAVAAGLTVLLVVIVRTAWLSDDAYITLRTIDNFVNGFGLRWNVAERVQSFTHPGWLLAIVPFYYVTHEAYYTVIVLQIAISLIAASFVLRRVATSWADVGLVVAALAGSKAFVEYSTSGLENPLTHLAVIGFLIHWRNRERGTGTLAGLGLLTSVLLLCRLDLAVLVGPLVLSALWPLSRHRVLTFVAGLVPFVAWELVSLVYYGQIVPNTALAKLPQGVSMAALIHQGGRYFLATFQFDPVTPILLTVALAAMFWRGGAPGRLIGGGVLLHVIAVIGVGGDFMTGRFLTPAFVAAVVGVLMTVSRPASSRWTAALAGAIVIGAALNRAGPLRTGADFSLAGVPQAEIERRGVTDERRFYYPQLGLLRVWSGRGSPGEHPNAKYGVLIRQEEVRIFSSVGLVGFYAGPKVHIIDRNALTDPLLSRLPAEPDWRIGHFLRAVPDGYLESCARGENLIQDPRIRALFDDVLLATRGPIWSRDRWSAIARLF